MSDIPEWVKSMSTSFLHAEKRHNNKFPNLKNTQKKLYFSSSFNFGNSRIAEILYKTE